MLKALVAQSRIGSGSAAEHGANARRHHDPSLRMVRLRVGTKIQTVVGAVA
ncbi:hypothetical protein [Azospirillum endophyticum]